MMVRVFGTHKAWCMLLKFTLQQMLKCYILASRFLYNPTAPSYGYISRHSSWVTRKAYRMEEKVGTTPSVKPFPAGCSFHFCHMYNLSNSLSRIFKFESTRVCDSSVVSFVLCLSYQLLYNKRNIADLNNLWFCQIYYLLTSCFEDSVPGYLSTQRSIFRAHYVRKDFPHHPMQKENCFIF